MLIVGECINASNRTVADAIVGRDREFIEGITKAQIEAGADFIDVNVGVGQGTQGHDGEHTPGGIACQGCGVARM